MHGVQNVNDCKMSKNINYQNLSIKKEIEDPCETIVQPPIPLPTTIFSNEFNINEKEFNSGVNSSLMMGVNNPTHYSQTESPQQAFTSTTRSKPALKKRKTTRKRYVYSKPKKKNKKKKEAEKVLNTLNILNLQYLSEKRSNDNHSNCSSDTIILDDVNEEISGQYSSNELPNILCKTEELEPELGKLLISADMLTDATHEASTVSSKISNSKGRNKSSKMKNNPTEYEALQCKDSDVPLLFSIKREHEEISEPPILYPVTKEVVHTFSDNEKVEMAAFPSASEPLNEAVQPVTKKQKTKTTKRNNKKQAASKSKPNKILNENLTSDDFFSMKDKDFFSDQSFSKSNLLQNAVEKSKRKKPATKRKAPKKTVQTSAPLNNESVFEQWNNVNCLTNTSFTVNVAEKPKRKKSAPNRKTKKDSIEPKISFELEETSECNGLLSVKRAKKSAPRKKATRASTKKKEKKSTIIDSKKESDAAICVKKEVIDPSHSENSLKLAKSNAAECKVNASKVISSEIVNTDSLAIVSMSFEEENIKKESNDTLTFLLSVPDKSTETISDIDSSKSVMKKYVKKKSKASFCKSDTNLDNISSIPIDYIVSGSKLRSKTVTKPLPEPWQDSVASDSKLRSRIVTRSSRNLNALKIRKENESAPNRIVSIKTNISNNLPPRIMDKDKSSNDSDVMRPANHSSDTSVQEYSAISNVHFQNSFVDSRKNMHYPRIVIKKEPQDLTESTKTSLDSILSPIHFSNDSDKEKKSCDDLIISDPTPNLCNTSIPCNLNCNKLTQNPKIMARTHDEEIPQVKHSMKTYANTEESHNSVLSINTPNAVSDCQSFDNSVPSSQSKICESYNVFLSRIKKEPKEAEKNVTVVENSCTKKSNCVESEKYVFNKDSLTTSITNEISEENTHKKALLLQSNYNVSNLKTASANLDMNTLSINESLQSDKCNQEMPRLEPFIANVDKNYSVPFTSIDNVVSNIHASDNSAHTQLKTCKTAFDSFLNVTIKNEPEEAVEKYSYAGNSNSVVSIHSLDQQEYEKTASKRNSTNCLTGKIDNCKHNEILEESSSSFTSCNISNLKLKSSTLDTHELVRNKSSQSNSAALQMPQFAVSSRKAVANTNESCSVTVANATATPVCSRTPDNFEQIQLKTSKSSSDTFLKVQIKEEPKDFTDEIIANVRDERSSIEVQLCNELREENFCISQESSVLNSIDSYVNKSVQKVTEDKVDVPFSIRKSLEIPNVNSVLPALSIKQDICSDSENMTTTSVYQSAIIGEMDRNPSLVNVSYSAKSVSQSLTNQKTLQTVENNNYIASSVVTSHHENVVLDKFSKNPSSVNIDCSPGLIDQSSDHGNKLQTVENSNISIMTSHNKSTVYGRTDQNLYPVDKVFSSDNMDQVLIPERMPQTIEKSSLITSSAIVAHQESTINTSKDMNILPVDLDCSSDLSNKNFTNEKNSLFSSTTFDVEAAMFCENTHQSSIDFSEEHSDQCTDFPTSSNEKNNALSALSKETETELRYNHNSLKSDSSSCLSPKSGSNLSDNLMLNFRESSSNYTCVSHDKVIIESVENLVDFSEIPDKNSTPEKHLNDKHVDVHHSFIDEDQNSLDSKLLDMSDVSDSSGSDDELSDEEVEEFLDRVSNFISCFDDLLKLSDEDENEESVKYIEKCFDYISQAVIDTIGSNEESDSEHSLVTERITSELVTLSDIDSCSINDSTSFDMNEITVEGEDEENTCTQNETFERINSRPVRPSNIDSVSVVMNEITSERPVTSSNIDPCNVIEPVSVANNSGEESTCSQTARLERITSSPVTLSDTGPCNVIDSVSIDINKIISEEDLEKNAPSGIAAVEKIISTPITPISTDFCNVIEPVSVVINKMNSEELNTCNEAITFERIISRPVTSTHADPCNVLDSEKNICSQTTSFETTTISSVLNEISSPEEIEENICNQITISEGISGPVSAKDSYLCNVTNSVLPELEIMDDSMDSVQTEASSVSSFNLNQNDGKFDILFNFQKNLKKFFKHPYPGESCFKLTQQTKSELKYSRLHNIYQHICVKEMAEKLKIAAEAEGNSKYKVGDTVTFESYPLTKEEIECYYKLVVMSPSISLMSKCNSAVAVGPYTKSEINSANACDVTYRPISLNLVSSPLNLVSNPLNLLSNQAFQHDQLLKESSFENDNKESNEIPDHSSLLPGHSSLLPDHSSLLPDHSSLLQNIENDTQRTVSNDVSFDATSNLRLLLESLKGRILHLNEGKSIKDPTSQDHCKTFDECTLISRTEIHKNSHLNILTTNDTINIVKENEIILDLVEVSENSSSSNIPTVNNKMLNINDQNISSQLQNALIDISNSSKDKQTDTIQNVGTVNKSYLKSQNTEIEPPVFENSIDPYFGNQLVSNLSLKSIYLKQQLPFSDSVVEQEENVQVEECSSQLPNLLCNQYENILMPQNLENTSEPKSSHFIQLPVLNSHNEESCFEKAKDVQVCTMDHNISAQSSKSEGSCSSVKETAIFPNPILNKVDVPVTDLLKILQTANNLPISDHEGLPFASLNFKETRDYDHSVLSQNSFQDNISYDQDCLHNAKYLNRSNYGGDYQPLLKIPVVRDYGHKSAEDLDFDHSPVTFKEKDQISVQTIDKLSNDVCSPKSINIPNNNLNNECVDSNSELHIRSTCDGQDLKIFSNNLEEIESSNKKENEQHVPQYKSRWEKIMERKSLETSSQTKFSNHLLKDCFPVKLSKNKLKLKKPIAHVQPCSQSLTKDSLKLKEFPSLSNLPLHTKSIKANSPLHTKSVKADPPLHTKTAKADPPLHTKSVKADPRLHTKSVKADPRLHTKSVKDDPPLHTKSVKADPLLHTKSVKTKKGKSFSKKGEDITKSQKKVKSPLKNKSTDNVPKLFQPDKITRSKETKCSDLGNIEKIPENSSSSRLFGRITNRGSFLTQSSVNQPPKSKAVVGRKSIDKINNISKTPDEFHLMVSSPNIEIASTSKILSNDSNELLFKSNYKTQKNALFIESSIGNIASSGVSSENSYARPKSKNSSEMVTNFSLDITLQSSNNSDFFLSPEPIFPSNLSVSVLPNIQPNESCLPKNLPLIPNTNEGPEISRVAKRPLLSTSKIGIHSKVMKDEFLKLTSPILHRHSDLNRCNSSSDLNMEISSFMQSPSLIGSPIDLNMESSILGSPVSGRFPAVPSAFHMPNRNNHHRFPRSRHSKCICLPPRTLKASVGKAVFETINVLLLILEWNVDWLVQQQKNHDPPPISTLVRKVTNAYENIDEYYNTYFPLMLLETWQRIYMSWTHLNQASPYFCEITSYIVETHSIKVQCQTVFRSSDAERGIFPEESNIIMIKFGTKEKGGIKILGYITDVRVETFDAVNDSQNVCYRTLKFSNTENLQKLILTFIGAYTSDDFDLDQLIRIQVLCSIKSTLKQNDAMLFLKNSPLHKNILNPLNDGLRMVTLTGCSDPQKVKDSVSECVRDIIKGILSPHPLPLLTIAKSLPSSNRLLVLPPLIEKMKHSYKTKVLLCSRTTKTLTDIGFNLCGGAIKFVIVGKRADIHQKLRKYLIDELAMKRLTKDLTENSSQNEDAKDELLENAKIDVLKKCDVILSPIRNCHNDLIAKAWADGGGIAQMCCIIDEANLCTESEILIPLLYGMSKLILIGDPDVPAKVCSKAASNLDYNRSLFHRAYELDVASE